MENVFKKVFIKNDDSPLTRKENDRLHTKMKGLRTQEGPDEPVNVYKIKSNKLDKNEEVIDEFNLNNSFTSLFQ